VKNIALVVVLLQANSGPVAGLATRKKITEKNVQRFMSQRVVIVSHHMTSNDKF